MAHRSKAVVEERGESQWVNSVLHLSPLHQPHCQLRGREMLKLGGGKGECQWKTEALSSN